MAKDFETTPMELELSDCFAQNAVHSYKADLEFFRKINTMPSEALDCGCTRFADESMSFCPNHGKADIEIDGDLPF